MACLAQTQELETPEPKIELSLEAQVFLSFKHRTPNRYKLLDTMIRANIELDQQLTDKTIYLSEKAKKIFKTVILKLLRGETVTLNHKYLSKATLCKSDQNWNILKELFKIFDINYHRLFKLNGRFIERTYHVQLHPAIIRELRDAELSNSEFYPEFFRRTNTNRNNFNKVKDIDLESNFSENSKVENITTSELVEIEKEEAVGNERDCFDLDTQQKPVPIGIQRKYRIPNKRKKPTNSEKKAKVIYFNQYKEPENLAYHYPLNNEDCTKLQSKSGRPFCLTATNEILLDMSKRVYRTFKSKARFMSYFGKCLAGEMRDAVKTDNVNFKIKANLTEEDKQQRIQESFLSEVEQQAITSVCPENQLKARLANVLEKTKAYELLLHFRRLEVTRDVMQIYLTDSVELTTFEKSVVLRHAQSIYSTKEFSIRGLEYIIDNSGIGKFASKPVVQAKQPSADIPTGIWGEIRKELIVTYGAAVDRNWFSKLTANVDEVASTIELKYPSQFVADWISTNYEDTIKAVVAGFGMNFKGKTRQTLKLQE